MVKRLLTAIFRVLAPPKPSASIPVPKGSSPKAWRRVSPPKRSRRKFTAEEIAEDEARYDREMLASSKARTEFAHKRMEMAGVKTFIWRTAKDSAVCPDCAKNEGKRFRYSKPPAIGFPGDHKCRNGEWCRCIEEPNI